MISLLYDSILAFLGAVIILYDSILAFLGGDHSFTIHLSACLGGDHSFTIHFSAFLGGCSASSRGSGGRLLAFLAVSSILEEWSGPLDEGLEVESLYFRWEERIDHQFRDGLLEGQDGWDERTDYRIHCVLRRVSLLDD